MERSRSHAPEWAATGAGMLGAGVAGNALLDERLRRRGAANLGLSTYRTVRRRPNGLSMKTHGPHLAGRALTRGVQLAGVPVLAAGLYGMATRRKMDRVRPGRDVIKPTLRSTLAADNLAKALTAREQRAVTAHKKAGQGLALVSGSLGVAALGLRSPQGAKALVRRGVKSPTLRRVAGKEAAATRISDTLGVSAIGAGSVGSFNYARQQQLERRQFAKGFLSEHRDRISPDAERGYRTLRSQRNDAAVSGAGSAALAGLSGVVLHSERKSLSRPALALTAAGGIAAGIGAYRSGSTAARRQRSMSAIEAKGRVRARLGLYGPGRGKDPVDTSSARSRRYAS